MIGLIVGRVGLVDVLLLIAYFQAQAVVHLPADAGVNSVLIDTGDGAVSYGIQIDEKFVGDHGVKLLF